MRRRLYFLINTVEETNQVVDFLLTKRVAINKMHVVAREGTAMGDLPEASILQKNDIIHSFFLGMCFGAILGIIAGIIGHNAMDLPIGGGLIATAVIGAILGGWAATMVGLMVPNVRLKNFHDDIEHGKLLLMVDAQKERVHELEHDVHEKFPNVGYKGIEPTIPAFP